MRYSDPAEHERLHAKAEQLWQIGVRDFALLFDDIAGELGHLADRTAFGTDRGAAGAAHGYTCTRFVDRFLAPRGVDEPLLMVPVDYAGTAGSPYRRHLRDALPPSTLVWWTGPDVVSAEITRRDIEDAATSYGHRLLLWDNFPVNDYDRTRLFLGPLTGRTPDPDGASLAGISANPMVEAAPSQLALATVADYAWNPHDYDAAASAARTVRVVAGRDAHALAPLVHACAGWPPDTPQDPRLRRLVTAALDDDLAVARPAARAVRTHLGGLARLAEASLGDTTLVRQLGPWIRAGADMARAGRRAAELLLAHLDGTTEDELRERTAAALEDAERHYPDVLRDVVPTFVREVLRRTGGTAAAARTSPWVMLVAATHPEAGEETFAASLRRRGLEVRFSATGDLGHDPVHPPELVVLARSAGPDAARAAARLPVPMLAWAHLVAAGLATESAVLLVEDSIDVVAPGDALAAGLRGRVPVHRGPGKITWGEPTPDATVVARTVTGAHPTVFRYPTGAQLADGSVAPAPRVAVFLGRTALAPWLMTEDGGAIVAAAVAELTAPRTGHGRSSG